MTTQAEMAPPLPAGLPADWLLDVDLPCPTCRYNLRKLHAPRCPECGGAFRWQTLLHISCPRCDASLESEDGGRCAACGLELDWARLLGDRDPAEFTQFEYTLRPKRAGLRTCVAALRPRSFWRELRIEWPPSVVRLRRLRLYAGSLFALGAVSLYLVVSLTIVMRWTSPDTLEQAAGWLAPLTPLLVTAALMPIFSPTLSRFRIRRDQLLRVFAYGAVGLGWLGIGYFGIALISTALPSLTPLLPAALGAAFPTPWFPDVLAGLEWLTIPRTRAGFSRLWGIPPSLIYASAALAILISVFGFLWWWRFLFVALRDYLRLKTIDAWALFLSTQAIAVLVTMLFLVTIGGEGWMHHFGRLLFP